MTSRLLCVLPAYNEERTVGTVARALLSQGFPVLVVDDCSSDATAEEAGKAGAEVLSHPENMGKGAAVLSAAEFAGARGYTHLLVLDADGQHDPAEAGRFAEAFRETGADIVLGTRMQDPRGMPFVRLWTNRVTSFVVSLLAGRRITDSQCGYRLMSIEVLRAVDLSSRRYDAESEFLVKACRMGFNLVEIPVRTIYGDEVSTVNPVLDTLRFLRLVGRLCRWLVFGRGKSGKGGDGRGA